jgi:23S rRNA pseudouridine955/2504/2580 synthase
MIEFRIDTDFAGVRLDKVLRQRLPGVPVSHLFKMIRTKKVRVNGKRASVDQALAVGDLVTLRGREEQLLGPAGPIPRPVPVDPGRLDVLFEDEWMMGVNKPSGMAVHAGSGITGGTLVDYVRAHLGPRAVRNGFAASPAHRLDRETSGVILVAVRRPAMVHFTEVFTEGRATKRYLALVKGRMPRPSGRIDTPLSEHQQTALSKARRGVKMQEAVTRWHLVAQGGEAALLSCTLETGRTHQIRRHLTSVGHPVAGDKKYGDFAFNREAKARWGLKRLFLHAASIEFPHPEDGRTVRLEAPLPPELREVLGRAGIAVP